MTQTGENWVTLDTGLCPKQNKASLQMSSIWPPANRNG
jgi:hypothetical protein